jgi:hypothetical protein
MEWLDVLVALVEYLRSGESKVGYLNAAVGKNMLHKSTLAIGDDGNNIGDDAGDIGQDVNEFGETLGVDDKMEDTEGMVGTQLGRSGSKRPWEDI